MKSASLVLIGCCIAVAAGCAAYDDGAPPTVTRELDPNGVEIVTSPAPTWSEAERWTVTAEPAVEIGVETGLDEYMLSNVGGAVRLSDGRIVVADGDVLVLRVYDANGQYLSSLGGRGGGPGEFGYLFGLLNCVEDELWALVLPRAFSRFRTDGAVIGLLRLSLPDGESESAHACNAARQHLVIGWGTPRRGIGLFRTTTRATVLSLDGEVLADLGEVFGSERWGRETGNGPHDYGKQTVLALGDDRAYIGEADDFEIREYALDGELVRRIRWQGRELAISPAEIGRYRSWVTETQELDPRAQELIKMEFPPTMPAYDTMMLDEAGNLWVRRFALPGIREDDWDVFSPEGVWQGTVAAPLGLEITEIGDDWLLGIFQDELGTEFVRLHRIERGSG
jgi:hypothetical protein